MNLVSYYNFIKNLRIKIIKNLKMVKEGILI